MKALIVLIIVLFQSIYATHDLEPLRLEPIEPDFLDLQHQEKLNTFIEQGFDDFILKANNDKSLVEHYSFLTHHLINAKADLLSEEIDSFITSIERSIRILKDYPQTFNVKIINNSVDKFLEKAFFTSEVLDTAIKWTETRITRVKDKFVVKDLTRIRGKIVTLKWSLDSLTYLVVQENKMLKELDVKYNLIDSLTELKQVLLKKEFISKIDRALEQIDEVNQKEKIKFKDQQFVSKGIETFEKISKVYESIGEVCYVDLEFAYKLIQENIKIEKNPLKKKLLMTIKDELISLTADIKHFKQKLLIVNERIIEFETDEEKVNQILLESETDLNNEMFMEKLDLIRKILLFMQTINDKTEIPVKPISEYNSLFNLIHDAMNKNNKILNHLYDIKSKVLLTWIIDFNLMTETFHSIKRHSLKDFMEKFNTEVSVVIELLTNANQFIEDNLTSDIKRLNDLIKVKEYVLIAMSYLKKVKTILNEKQYEINENEVHENLLSILKELKKYIDAVMKGVFISETTRLAYNAVKVM